jgi:uncharacterized protein
MDEQLKSFTKKLRNLSDFHRVKFIILFGSRAEGRAKKDSDYDLAVYYEGSRSSKYRFLINANFSEKFDVKIFQDLPLYIQKDVLRGKVLFSRDDKLIYEVAYQTIKSFDSYYKYYLDYIQTRKLRLKNEN